MDESTLYYVLNDGLLQKWREAIEKAEYDTWFFTYERDALIKLETELNEKSKKLLTAYSLAIENRMDYLYSILKNKILNLGIKIGMDVQKAFADLEV